MIAAVLLLDTGVEQRVTANWMCVIVIVVLPALARAAVENVPAPPLMVTDAVSPVAVLGELRL